MFTKKTTQSVFATFTQDLEEVKQRELIAAERFEILEAEAKDSKLKAVEESSIAAKAIDNINKMLRG